MKHNLKKVLAFVLASALALSLAACGGQTQAPANSGAASSAAASGAESEAAAPTGDVITLKLGTPAPAGGMNYNNSVYMKEKLEELSGGTMTIDIVPGAALGNVPQHFSQISEGTLDFFVVGSDASIAFTGGEDFFILSLPFLFRDEDHFNAFLESDVLADMSSALEEASGIKLMGRFGARNPRALSTAKTPVRTPDDLKGLIIRIPENAMLTTVWGAFGASTAQSSGAELFSGLQSGMFDGQENGIDTVVDSGLTEVQQYFIPLNQTYQCLFLWMSSKTWNSLTEEQQGWVSEAIAYADTTATDLFESETMPNYLKTIDDAGMTTVEDVDTAAFKEIIDGLVPELEGEYWSKGLYERIQEIQ